MNLRSGENERLYGWLNGRIIVGKYGKNLMTIKIHFGEALQLLIIVTILRKDSHQVIHGLGNFSSQKYLNLRNDEN